jgi:ribosomal protein L17
VTKDTKSKDISKHIEGMVKDSKVSNNSKSNKVLECYFKAMMINELVDVVGSE